MRVDLEALPHGSSPGVDEQCVIEFLADLFRCPALSFGLVVVVGEALEHLEVDHVQEAV